MDGIFLKRSFNHLLENNLPKRKEIERDKFPRYNHYLKYHFLISFFRDIFG